MSKVKAFILILASTLLIDCNDQQKPNLGLNFKSVVDSKKEFEKVLSYYHKSGPSNLKYQAALYLIRGIDNHHFIDGNKRNNFDFIFDSLMMVDDISLKKDLFDNLLTDVLKKKDLERYAVTDSRYINSGFLIENIDLAFKSWNRISKYLNYDFETFCRYVLPYRAYNERPEQGIRKRISEQYQWAYDSLEAGKAINDVVLDIFRSFKMGDHTSIVRFPFSYSMTQMEQKRSGNCNDVGFYRVNVLRALGIPSAVDIIPQWGAHYNLGHAWVVAKTSEDFIVLNSVFMPSTYERFDNWRLSNRSIPKIRRYMFDRKVPMDVTSQYIKTSDIKIEPMSQLNKKNKYGLYIFNRKQGWRKVVEGKILNGNEIEFFDMGINNIYLPAQQLEKGIEQINYPLHLDEDENKYVFRPKEDSMILGTITRKYPPISNKHDKRKKGWYSTLNGLKLQGSDNINFKNAKTLLTIKEVYSSNPQTVACPKVQVFKYYRMIKSDKLQLAEIRFIDNEGKSNNGRVFGNVSNIELLKLVDDDELSFSVLDSGEYVGIENEKLLQLKSIMVQGRNDGNHIKPGINYELFYWDRKWNSLGKRQAKDTLLNYQNIPGNSLLWLKCEEGMEEHVFSIDEQGRQFWPLVQ